jgi:D-glucosaminate PTS system EIIB component
MPVALYRVDDRLVHGQVVLGWGKRLNAGFVALVDEAVYASDWERDLYRMGMPPDMDLWFSGLNGVGEQLAAWRAEPRNGIVLTADVATMAALVRAAPPVERVNLGGIHHRAGRTQRLPYVYLTDEEYHVLEALQAEGTRVMAQDLPTTPAVPLEDLA